MLQPHSLRSPDALSNLRRLNPDLILSLIHIFRTSTGIWTVAYNSANRAVSFTSRGGATVVECGYDYQGRRYMKKVTQNGTVTSHERYL